MAKESSHIASRIVRKPLFALDSRFTVKWKFLFDSMPHDYTGYIDIWDTIPWQEVAFDDGETRDHNYAARAQFFPKYGGYGDYHGIYEPCVALGYPEEYCHNCMGLVQDLLALLEHDGIADELVEAQYSSEGDVGSRRASTDVAPDTETSDAHVAPTRVPLRNLFFREFNPDNTECPITFCRPMTYTYRGAGNICDNGQAAFFCRNEDICDGTTGLRETLDENHRREFWADVMWFMREIDGVELSDTIRRGEVASPIEEGAETAPLPADARLVLYILAAGSIPRICINGTWHVASDEYFPGYGDPYTGKSFRGRKFSIPLSECGLRFGAGDDVGSRPASTDVAPDTEAGDARIAPTETLPSAMNEFIIEHFSIQGDEVGAQVIFCIEYEEETIIIDETRRRKMAEKQGIPTTPIEHLALLELCNMKDDDPGNPAEYKFLAPEKTALTDALTLVTTKFAEWHTRSDELGELTAGWEPLEKQAKDLIGRARNLWSMRFEEGNVYERTAGIDDTPRKKERRAKALDRIVMVSNDNAGTLAELPPALITALQNLYTQTHDNLRNTELARGEHRGVRFIPPTQSRSLIYDWFV